MTKRPAQLLLAIAAVGVVGGPSLLGEGVDIPDDALYYMVPAWDWLRTAITSGQSIWFVPGKLGGTSLYVDVVPMGPLYPAWLLALILPTVTALGVASVLHAVGTLLAVRWLALVHGASRTAATLAGCGIVVGPLGLTAFQDAQMDTWPAFLWLPMVLGCLERLSQVEGQQRRRWIGLGALSLAMLFLGAHLRLAAASGAVVALWLLLRGKDLRGGMLICGLGLLAGLPGFLPMLLEVSLASAGTGEINKLSNPIDQALGLHAIPGIISPGLMVVGRDVGLGTVLGISLVAGIASTGRELRRLAFFSLILVLAGTHIPGLHYLFAPLVVLSHPVNLVYPALACFPVAILAAKGLDSLLSLEPDALTSWLKTRTGAVVLALIGTVLARVALGKWGFPSGYGWFMYSIGAVQAAIVIGLLYSLFATRTGESRRQAVFVLCLLDLCLFAVRGHLAVPSQPIISPTDNVRGDLALLEGGYLDIKDLSRGYDSTILGMGLGEEDDEAWAQDDETSGRDMQSDESGAPVPEDESSPDDLEEDTIEPPVSGDSIDTPEVDAPALQAELLGRHWPPHLGVSSGISGLSGRSKLAPARQVEALGPLAEALQDVEPTRDILGTLFGRAVGEPERVGEYNDDVTCGFQYCDHVGTRTLALHGISNAVWEDKARYRLDAVVPRCYSPTSAKMVSEPGERLEQLLTRPFQTAGPVLLEEPLDGLSVLTEARVSCKDERSVHVEASSAAMVVFRERWHPGWQVQDQNGSKLSTFPVNQVHLGVLVEAGTHQLNYRFVPPGLHLGLLLSLPALLLALALALLRTRRTPGQATVSAGIAALALFFASPVNAATGIDGVVTAWSPDASYEVWLTTSLDLSAPGQPALRASVDDGSGRFHLDIPAGHEGPSWLFLHQRVEREGKPPLVFYLPWDLLPIEELRPPDLVRLRAIPPDLAELRETGERVPGSWQQSLYLALVIYLGGAVLLWLLARLHATALGAQTLLATSRGLLPDSDALRSAANSPPLAGTRAAPTITTRERTLLGLILALTAALRIPGLFGAPLELLEYTYGPGSRAAAAGSVDSPSLLAQLLRPSSLEVTHPPLYHWLLSGLDMVSHAEWLIRTPALLSSLATVWLSWLLFRRLSPTVGLLTAAACACAAPSVHFGADATPYAFMGVVAVGSLLLLLRALTEPGLRPWLHWIGLIVVGTLCHYAVVPFALAQIAALGAMTLIRRSDPRWAVALSQAVRAGMILAPVPLLWSLLHFGYFPPIALDTRLFADTYPRDPGLGRFVSEFWSVAVGISPNKPILGLLTLPLLVTGLTDVYRRHRVLGNLLLVMIAAFLGGVTFFHSNLTWYLNGRVFFGFRWISWLLPLIMGLAACGALGLPTEEDLDPAVGRRAQQTDTEQQEPRSKWGLRRLILWPLGLAWLALAAQFTLNSSEHTTHPDYAAAAAQIRAELNDRDAIATLPLWAQRGPLSWYMQRDGSARLREVGGVLGWHFSNKLTFLEATNERLPFQSSARNSHFDRLWLAVVDERMFGRQKFSSRVAEDALRWAQDNLISDGNWQFRDLRLYRFRQPQDQLLLNEDESDFRLTAGEHELSSLPWLEPNMSGCIEMEIDEDGEDDDSAEESHGEYLTEDGMEWRWLLNPRVPLSQPGAVPRAVVQYGDLYLPTQPDPDYWQGTIEGGPCAGPAPVLNLLQMRDKHHPEPVEEAEDQPINEL